MDDQFENDYIDITLYEDSITDILEVEIPEDEFEISSAEALYEEIKADTVDELDAWYLASNE